MGSTGIDPVKLVIARSHCSIYSTQPFFIPSFCRQAGHRQRGYSETAQEPDCLQPGCPGFTYTWTRNRRRYSDRQKKCPQPCQQGLTNHLRLKVECISLQCLRWISGCDNQLLLWISLTDPGLLLCLALQIVQWWKLVCETHNVGHNTPANSFPLHMDSTSVFHMLYTVFLSMRCHRENNLP